MKKSSIILIIIALFPFLSYAQDTKPLITLSTTTVSPDNDDDGEPIEELAITLHLGAAKSTPIRIDWGDGNLLDYTIGSSEPVSVSETVDLGAKIKIYGDISFVDASQTYLVAVELGQAATLNVLRLSQNNKHRPQQSSEPKRTDDYRQQNIGTQYRSVPTSTGTILRLQQPQQSDTQQ